MDIQVKATIINLDQLACILRALNQARPDLSEGFELVAKAVGVELESNGNEKTTYLFEQD